MVDWSYSTARLFTSCPRAFFYQQQARADAATSTAARDGDLATEYVTSPGTLVGTAVHRGISQQIDRWRRGESTSMQAAQSTAADLIQMYSDPENEEEVQYNPAADGISISPQLADSLAGIANSHLQTFFQVVWSRFTAHRYIGHETASSFTVQDHTVWVRPDLCTRDTSGDLVITDWKTAEIDADDQSLQLGVYALWAHRQYEPDLDRIRAQSVYTRTGEFDQIAVTRQSVADVRDRILADCRDWKSREARSAFPPDPEFDKCHQCPYLYQCPAGQEIVESDTT